MNLVKTLVFALDISHCLRYNIPRAGLAQLVEQLICNQQVLGSSPTSSSTPNAIASAQKNSHFVGVLRFIEIFLFLVV